MTNQENNNVREFRREVLNFSNAATDDPANRQTFVAGWISAYERDAETTRKRFTSVCAHREEAVEDLRRQIDAAEDLIMAGKLLRELKKAKTELPSADAAPSPNPNKKLQCRAAPSAPFGPIPPSSIEWMPAGSHTIHCSTGGKPQVYLVICDQSDCLRLDAQLQKRLSAAAKGKAARPFIDFNHYGSEAAAIPVRFYWDNGIRLEIEWTIAGENAIRGRSYSYFSPEFFIRDDGHPESIPETGPIGGLVNNPAFETIERISALSRN